MSNPRETVSTAVRTLLAAKGRTRAELAQHLGYTPGVITKALKCDRPWTLDDLVKMADFFQVGPATFFMDAAELIPALGDNIRHTQGYGTTDDELLMVAA